MAMVPIVHQSWLLFPEKTVPYALMDCYDVIDDNFPVCYTEQLRFLNDLYSTKRKFIIPVIRGSLALDVALELSEDLLEETDSMYFDYRIRKGVRMFDARLPWLHTSMLEPQEENAKKFLSDLATWTATRMLEAWRNGVENSPNRFIILAPETEELCKWYFEVFTKELYQANFGQYIQVSDIQERLIFRFATVEN